MADATQIKLETMFPRCLDGSWSAETYAEHAGVSVRSAKRFLRDRYQEVALTRKTKFVGITDGMWTVLAERALLDRDALQKLNEAQQRGELVPDKLVSSLVKRLISVLNVGRTIAPRDQEKTRNGAGLIAMNSTV